MNIENISEEGLEQAILVADLALQAGRGGQHELEHYLWGLVADLVGMK